MDIQFLADVATVLSVIIGIIALWQQWKSTDKKIENLTDIINLQNQYFSNRSQNIKATNVTVYNTTRVQKRRKIKKRK